MADICVWSRMGSRFVMVVWGMHGRRPPPFNVHSSSEGGTLGMVSVGALLRISQVDGISLRFPGIPGFHIADFCLYHGWGLGCQCWGLVIWGMHGRRPPLFNVHPSGEGGTLGMVSVGALFPMVGGVRWGSWWGGWLVEGVGRVLCKPRTQNKKQKTTAAPTTAHSHPSIPLHSAIVPHRRLFTDLPHRRLAIDL